MEIWYFVKRSLVFVLLFVFIGFGLFESVKCNNSQQQFIPKRNWVNCSICTINNTACEILLNNTQFVQLSAVCSQNSVPLDWWSNDTTMITYLRFKKNEMKK